MDEHYKRISMQQKKNKDALTQMLSRDKELDTLYERLVELPTMSQSEKENYIRCFSRTKKDQSA